MEKQNFTTSLAYLFNGLSIFFLLFPTLIVLALGNIIIKILFILTLISAGYSIYVLSKHSFDSVSLFKKILLCYAPIFTIIFFIILYLALAE